MLKLTLKQAGSALASMFQLKPVQQHFAKAEDETERNG